MVLLSLSMHFNFLPLFLVIAVAWLAPILLSVLKLKNIPSVIIEILFGYLIGLFFLSNQSGDSFKILEFLGLSGFLFLMFLSGLEIDMDQIITSFPRKKLTITGILKNPLLIGILYFIIVVILSYASTFPLSYFIHIEHRWYFALIMVTTSVGIVLPVLKNRGDLSTRYGQMIIIAAAIADVLGIILFTFTAFIIRQGFKFELFYILILFFIFFIFYKISLRLRNIYFLKKLFYQLSHAASQIKVRGSVLIMLIFVVISQYIGEEVILLGAFLSGLLMSTLLHKERSVLMIKLDGMGYGFFIPIFFIMVGVLFDPSALKEFDHSLIWFLIALFVVLFVIKLIPAILWSPLFGKRKALAGGFLMASQLSLIIAASTIGLQLGVITPGINAGFVLMAVLTTLIAPVMFNIIAPKNKFEGEKILLIGGSSTAVLLARRMNVHGKKAFIIENNRERFREIKSKGLQVLFGDGLDISVYEKTKLKPNNYVVISTGNDKRNYEIAELLRKNLMHERIITRACKLPCVEKLQLLGIEAVDVHRVVAIALENLILRPTTYHELVESFENYNLEEITVTNNKITDKQIKEIAFDTNAILIMVKRKENLFIPHGNTYLQTGDTLHVLGTRTAMENVRAMISQ